MSRLNFHGLNFHGLNFHRLSFRGCLGRLGFALGVFLVALTSAGASVRAAELLYFQSSACPVCERWDEEIGGIYDKTDEGRRLPLRMVDVHADAPDDIAHVKGVTFTPTFVLVEDGREVGRIVGYISDYFFWEQIAGLIKRADMAKVGDATACGDKSIPSPAGTPANSKTC